MRTSFKRVLKGIKHQLPLKRLFRNFFITGNAWGMFSKNSHIVSSTGKEKVGYNTKESARKAADSMQRKYGNYYAIYYCIFCGKYHIGKNLK